MPNGAKSKSNITIHQTPVVFDVRQIDMTRLFLMTLLLGTSYAADLELPDGFELHRFDIGGLELGVPKPNDWHANVMNTKGAITYRVTKELNENGSYYTGMSYQLISEVSKKTEVSPTDFQLHQIKQIIERPGIEVLAGFKPEDIGNGFTRAGVRVKQTMNINNEQKNYITNYSLFAHIEADLLIIAIFGTPEQNWEENQPYFNALLRFNLMRPENEEK